MTKLTRTLLVVFILLLTACTDFDEDQKTYEVKKKQETELITTEINNCTFGENDGTREAVLNNIRHKNEIATMVSECIQKARTGHDPDDIEDVVEECKLFAYEIHSGIMPDNGNRSKIQLVTKNIAECGDLNKTKEK